MACDLYVAKFLADVKFGEVLGDEVEPELPKRLTDEAQIYEYLRENRGGPIYGDLAKGRWGMAAAGEMDMYGLDRPLFYDPQKRVKNWFASVFVHALAEAVKHEVSRAGGHEKLYKSRSKTDSERAAEWFVNHYPLLGGIASGL